MMYYYKPKIQLIWSKASHNSFSTIFYRSKIPGIKCQWLRWLTTASDLKILPCLNDYGKLLKGATSSCCVRSQSQHPMDFTQVPNWKRWPCVRISRRRPLRLKKSYIFRTLLERFICNTLTHTHNCDSCKESQRWDFLQYWTHLNVHRPRASTSPKHQTLLRSNKTAVPHNVHLFDSMYHKLYSKIQHSEPHKQKQGSA